MLPTSPWITIIFSFGVLQNYPWCSLHDIGSEAPLTRLQTVLPGDEQTHGPLTNTQSKRVPPPRTKRVIPADVEHSFLLALSSDQVYFSGSRRVHRFLQVRPKTGRWGRQASPCPNLVVKVTYCWQNGLSRKAEQDTKITRAGALPDCYTSKVVEKSVRHRGKLSRKCFLCFALIDAQWVWLSPRKNMLRYCCFARVLWNRRNICSDGLKRYFLKLSRIFLDLKKLPLPSSYLCVCHTILIALFLFHSSLCFFRWLPPYLSSGQSFFAMYLPLLCMCIEISVRKCIWLRQVDNVSSLSFPQNRSSNNEVQADIRDGKMV